MVADLKFVFWQKLFTHRHDTRIWDAHLKRLLPNLDGSRPVAQLRMEVYDGLEQVRALRNRIAHHEPIFARDLERDFMTICSLIAGKCSITASWMKHHQLATQLLATKPHLGQHNQPDVCAAPQEGTG